MKALLTCAFLLSLHFYCRAQKQVQFYYLSIGSADYEQNPKRFAEPGFVPFDNLPQAQLSASLMSKVFEKYTHAKGITLISSPSAMITKKRLFYSLNELEAQVKKDKAKRPFIILYYCGHGISENMGWNQFLIPGDYTAFPGNKSFDSLLGNLIFLGDITDSFLKRHYDYMVLVDCCREQGKDSSLPEKRLSYFFDQQNLETFKIVVQGLKYLNEYHQANPVVFAITPGKVAPTVILPEQEFVQAASDDEVGPICRRSLLVLNHFEKSGKQSIIVSEFINAIISGSLDNKSPQSISYYEDKTKNAALFKLFIKLNDPQ